MNTTEPAPTSDHRPQTKVATIYRDCSSICEIITRLQIRISALQIDVHVAKTWSLDQGFLDAVHDLQTISWHLTMIENNMMAEILPQLEPLRESNRDFAEHRGIDLTQPPTDTPDTNASPSTPDV